jgi:ABC-type multidrug transport system ATPase subunit
MWKLISSTMANRSVILTTHSMEECEALCDRIGIMTGGRLRCLGTAPHLKQRFGSGYQVIAKAREGSAEEVLAWVQRTYPSTQVLEVHGSSFKFRISKQEAGPTSAVFRAFESNKQAIGLDSYSVSDTDLEQIFIQMVRDQEDTDRAAGEEVASPNISQ